MSVRCIYNPKSFALPGMIVHHKSRFKGYRSVLLTTNRSMNLIKTGPSHPPSPPRDLQPRGLCETSVSSIMSRTGRTRGLRPEGCVRAYVSAKALLPNGPDPGRYRSLCSPKTHEQLWPTKSVTHRILQLQSRSLRYRQEAITVHLTMLYISWGKNGIALFRKKFVLRICGPYVKAAGQDPILTAKIWTKPLS